MRLAAVPRPLLVLVPCAGAAPSPGRSPYRQRRSPGRSRGAIRIIPDHALRSFILALLLAFFSGACGEKDPARPPINHAPVISAALVFPQTLGPGDSAIVICNATDSDGDLILYDWYTDGRLRIKGAFLGVSLYDSPYNTQVFYYNHADTPVDTAWIQVNAKDQRGMSDAVRLFPILTQ